MKKLSIKNSLLIILSAIICAFFGGLVVNIKNVNTVYAKTPQTSDSYYCVKDTNFLITDNQDRFGVCWTFGSTNALESYIAKTTGQVYDFSEAWVAVCNSIETPTTKIGSGGSFEKFYELVTKYGLLLESEFPYEMLYNIDSSNIEEVFNIYKDKTHKEFLQNLDDKVFYNGLNQTGYSNDYIISIKDYLINYGALSLSYNDLAREDKNICESLTALTDRAGQKMSGHQISLIGWDDTYTFTDSTNTVQTGAFICLNNWGTDDNNENYFISYNDLCLSGFELPDFIASVVGMSTGRYRFVYGFSQNANKKDFDVAITSSNSNLINYEVKKYDNNEDNNTTGVYENKNLFNYGDNINIVYTYEANFGVDYDVSCRLLRDGKLLSGSNTTISLDLNVANKKLTVTSNKCDSGKYCIYFDIDKNKDGTIDISYPVEIYVFSEAEIGRTKAYESMNYETVVFSDYNRVLSTESENVVYGFTKNNYIDYNFEVASINTIKETSKISMGVTFNYYTYTPKTNANTEGYIQVRIRNLNKFERYEHKFEMTTASDSKVKIKLITYGMEGLNDKKVYAFYDLDGGTNTNNASYFALGAHYSSYSLQEPVKSGYEFDGWYLDKELTNKVTNSTITADNIKARNNDNYADEGNMENLENTAYYQNYYVVLYAKWKEESLTFDDKTLASSSYGEQVQYSVTPARNGSGDYTYQIVGNLPLGLTFNQNSLTISGLIRQSGTLSFTVRVTDNITTNTKNATYSVVILQRAISYRIDNKQSGWGQDLMDFSGEVIEGSVLDGDNLEIEYSCAVSKYGSIRSYPITAVCKNTNYNVTFINGVYELVTNPIEISLISYNDTYDGEYHSVEFEYDADDYSSLNFEYSTDNVNYSASKPSYKDVITTNIWVRVSTTGYSTVILSGSININPIELDIIWSTEASFTYNGTTQCPTAMINYTNVVSGDVLEISVSGGGITVGSYTATCACSNTNYKLNQSLVEKTFQINKADATINKQQIDTLIKFDKDAIIDAVTWADLELPSGYSWKYADSQIGYGTNKNVLIYNPDPVNYNSVEVDYTIEKASTGLDLITVVAIAVGVVVVLTAIALAINKAREKAEAVEIYGKKEKKVRVNPHENQVIIKFVTNSPIQLAPMVVNKREISALPQLQRNYYEFCGWYTDKLFLEPYKSNGVEPTLTLYAKWKVKL